MSQGRRVDPKVAVALEYAGAQSVPVVSASGRDVLAEAIVDAARRQGVLIAEDRHLAAALSRLEIDEAIPEHLFSAVAVLLSWSYWLRGLSPSDGRSED